MASPLSTIEDHAIVGDLHTAALIARDGSVDWMCLPRFDSDAAFAGLLGGPKAGRWRVAPLGGGTCTERRYCPDTSALGSTWQTPTGIHRGCAAVQRELRRGTSSGTPLRRSATSVWSTPY